MKKEFVLASASPRRLAILQQIGIFPKVVVSEAAEVKDGLPEKVVKHNALAKGQAVSNTFAGENKIIIASDTIVVADHHILGKPQSEADAFAMLTTLSGRSHWVYSGLALIDTLTGDFLVDFDKTEVFFHETSQQDLVKYLKTGEPMDKAGAYGIQEKGALLVKKIVGDYYTVMGLPLPLLKKMLSLWHIDLWDYVK